MTGHHQDRSVIRLVGTSRKFVNVISEVIPSRIVLLGHSRSWLKARAALGARTRLREEHRAAEVAEEGHARALGEHGVPEAHGVRQVELAREERRDPPQRVELRVERRVEARDAMGGGHVPHVHHAVVDQPAAAAPLARLRAQALPRGGALYVLLVL